MIINELTEECIMQEPKLEDAASSSPEINPAFQLVNGL